MSESDDITTATLAKHRIKSWLRGIRNSARPEPLPDTVAEWEINGHDIQLRAPRYSDFQSWRAARLRNQAEMEPHWDSQDRTWEERHSLGDFVDLVKDSRRGRQHRTSLVNFMIVDGEVAGEMSLAWIHEHSATAEISLWIDKQLHDRQVRDTSFIALRDFGFDELGLVRLSAPLSVYNKKVQLSAARMGMTFEGVMRWYGSVDGKRVDHQIWAITRDTVSTTPAAGTEPDVESGDPASEQPVISCFDKSIAAQSLLHSLVPGGAHTYARGEDQYPDGMAPIISYGSGSRVWDLDGNEFIEYGAGLRSVTLGHAFEPVISAVRESLYLGNSFSRPSRMEIAAAQSFLETVPTADMVKFAKNGSDATTAAVRLARAVTGRTTVAICDQPFFSVDDWFIGTTAMNAGTRDHDCVSFSYNDIEYLRTVLSTHDVAAVIMEAATSTVEPEPGYLQAVRDLCTSHGTVLVFDEMITGFRWAPGGAQAVYGVTPDLSCWGKALGNGFPISALAGTRDIMEAGGLRATGDRVFLLSTTHGPETSSLAAMRAVIATYAASDPIGAMEATGRALKNGVNGLAREHGIEEHLYVTGRPSSLVFVTRDADGLPSQEFRTLTLSGLTSRGVLGQSLVNTAAHTAVDVEQTVDAFAALMPYYRKALEEGSALPYFSGRPVTPAIRRTAEPRTPFT